jgi:hypothetical protein
MRLYLDLDSRNFLESPRFPRALSTLALKRRDTDSIELQYLRDTTVQELPAGTTIRLGLKPAADYTGDFLASGTFTKTGTGTSTKYLLDLNLNTASIDTAFSSTPTEPETLAAMLEIEWTTGTTISSSKTLPVTIANDVIRGDEGEPADLPVFYTAETSDFKATQAEAETGTNNLSWMSPLRTFQAIAAWVSANPIATTWSTLTGKPETFPPESHVHNASQITDFNSAVVTASPPTDWENIPNKPSTFPPEAHSHDGSDIDSGEIDIAYLPTGTTGTTLALGNHGHATLQAPVAFEGSDTLTLHEWGIEHNQGPTELSFEEASLYYDNSEVLNWGTTGELHVGARRLVNVGSPVNANDAVRKIDLDNLSVPSSLTQQVTSIAGTSNHNLTTNRWHIFTGSPSTGNHTFTLPQNAANGDLVYITFLTTATTGFQVMRFGYEGGNPQVVHGAFETGKTYLFHYNDFDTARWRRVDFQSGATGGVSSWNDLLDKPATFPPSAHSHAATDITSGTLANARTTATSANTASAIVARDASGNFSAGTITATLSGNATNVTGTVAVANGGTGATTAATARTNLGLGNSATLNTGTTAGTVATGNHTHSNYVTTSGGITAIAVVSTLPATPDLNTLYIVTA